MKKKILFTDRGYATRYVKSEKFEGYYVALSVDNKKDLQVLGLNVIACFEEEFDALAEAEVTYPYLKYSFQTDRFLNGRFNHEERIRILRKEKSFWSRVLDDLKPDLIVNEVCTTEFFEVLCIEAQKRNIRYESFLFGFVPGKFYWLSTPFNSELDEEAWSKAIINEKTIEDADHYIEEIKGKQYLPWNIKNISHNIIRSVFGSLHAVVKAYIDRWRNRSHFYYEDYVQQRIYSFRISWSRLFHHCDKKSTVLGKEYVFFPLHFVPEASINYFSEFFYDQVSIIENISRCLKENQYLVVKEHPAQVGLLSTKDYRRVKNKCSNIIYISGAESSMDIACGAKCIVTITGTVGYEGLIIGKPVISMGNVFYNHNQDVMHINSYKELKEIIREDKLVYPNENRTLNFVREFIGIQVNGVPYLNTKVTQKGIDDFTQSIETKL